MSEQELLDYEEAKGILTRKVTSLREAGLDEAAVATAGDVIDLMTLKMNGQVPLPIFKKVWPNYPSKNGGFN